MRPQPWRAHGAAAALADLFTPSPFPPRPLPQDGAYLTEFLLNKGYIVHGIKRRASILNTSRIDRFYEEPQAGKRLFLHYGDLTDSTNLIRIVQLVKPDEIYNLGAQSHVAVSFECPEYTADTDGVGTLRLLEAIRILGLEKTCRLYQASTSELYGKVQEIPQKITTPFYPRSPYAVAKLYAFWITVNYREAYGMYACNGVLFNHESPLRGETFVTRKVSRGAEDARRPPPPPPPAAAPCAQPADRRKCQAALFPRRPRAHHLSRCSPPLPLPLGPLPLTAPAPARVLRRRSRAPWPASSSASRTASTWATWTPSATGATPATTWRCSGSCCSRRSRATT